MKQSLGQSIWDTWEQLVCLESTKSSLWIARPWIKDYWIDLELELKESMNLTANFLKIQVKTHDNISIEGWFIKESISKDFLKYAYDCKIPVILVILSLKTSQIWYLWTQKWIVESNSLERINSKNTKKITIKIPEENDFISWLKTDLIKIAKWEDDVQINLILKDLSNLSLAIWNKEVTRALLSLLNASYIKNFDNKLLDFLISEFCLSRLMRGQNIISELFYDFTRKYWSNYTLDNLLKIIIPGQWTYSRNWLRVLSIMYDDFFDYTKSLKIKRHFEDTKNDPLFYYCTLRERYKEREKCLELLENGFIVNNLTINPSNLDSIFEKMPNRWDSVILDYLEPKVN